ncbi:MAG: hypothetical protein A2Z34_11320 [Planctomycetes bacterium RBG_16_59_8]|nr:MAG: hypothetical protein A2Z34_11320 [Planctomycetes bacterium RBG_16_59_8]
MKPCVSVVIPVFNCARFVAEAIESVFAQSFADFELIVIDDASTDESARICARYGERIRLLKNETNGGIGYTRHRGAREARGRHIAYLSADDVWYPEYLETMIEEATKHPGKILFSRYYFVKEDGDPWLGFVVPPFRTHEEFKSKVWDYAERFNCFVNFSTTFFPIEVFGKVSFDPDQRICEDLKFLLQSMEHFEYHLVEKPLLKYRLHETNQTKIHQNDIRETVRRIIRDVKARNRATERS